MTAYYNEIDPYAADWLRNLISAGHIADGVVDERSIVDIDPAELADYTQCHFFAGIGGWSYALRLAGWPDERPVWTGSCPCQPFSTAGKGQGHKDERHLWPAWFRLISECRPAVVFGEQVASPDGLGWLDAVCTDMEAQDYAIGAADLCAAGVGAPHIRQRLYFVANAGRERGQPDRLDMAGETRESSGSAWQQRLRTDLGPSGIAGVMADTDATGLRTHAGAELHHAEHHAQSCGELGDASNEGFSQCISQRIIPGRARGADAGQAVERAGVYAGFWPDADWLPCRDGKSRPVEPGTFPLAHGVSARVGRLRAYGNAIVGPLAAKFIEAAMTC